MGTSKAPRLIGIKEVMHKTSYSRTTIYQLVKDEEFPPAVPLSVKRVAWLEHEVDEWIQEQINKRELMTDMERKGAQCF